MTLDVITVSLTEDGETGRGEGTPYPRYGETATGALAAIAAVRPAIEAGVTRADLRRIMPPGAARNAIDCALWDLEARRGRTSVAALLGTAEPVSCVTALTIGIDTPQRMAEAARAMAGHPLLKIKLDRVAPAERLRAVRAAAPDAVLIVDANESWTMADLIALQPVLRGLAVAMIEQPLPAGADAALRGFEPAIPIAADESVHVAADVAELVGKYQMVNIKLDKAGGLTEALALARAARDAGLGVMAGCMIATSLAIAPAFHLARLSRFVDFDGPLWLTDDHADGVALENGRLAPPAPRLWGGRP